jgi:NitT/TauT family transport system substrate-binding protein
MDERRRRRWSSIPLGLAVVAMLALAACGGDDGDAGAEGAATEESGPTTLRLGYFPNVTHAPAIIGVEEGLFEAALGDDVTFETATFNAGPEATEALFSEAIDATFIGPNPAINAFAQSDGEAIRIIAGSTSGGAALVVKPGITKPADLKGKVLATPQLANTQDVALRAWLDEQGLETDTTGGGDVSIKPQANADTLTAFQAGTIDGAWVPEPWATRLVLEGGGEILLDERDIWPGGRFVTTHLIVRTEYLEEHPSVVKRLLEGLVDAVEVANGGAADATATVNAGIERVTTKPLPRATIDGAWKQLTFTWDPVASSLQKSKDDAVAVGLLDEVDLDGIYALDLLNEILADRGEDEVEGL